MGGQEEENPSHREQQGSTNPHQSVKEDIAVANVGMHPMGTWLPEGQEEKVDKPRGHQMPH